MKMFAISKHANVICEAKNTRNGFKHEATLILYGQECESVKINYQNRTWERYEYESVLSKLLDKTTNLDDQQKRLLARKIKNQQF